MKTVLILGNSSAGLVNFRMQIVKALLEQCRVVVSLPDDIRTDVLRKAGCIVVKTPIDRRGMNPAADLKLLRAYRELLRNVQPDLVLTYTIKPNVYGGMACQMAHIPYIATVTGLGSAFQKNGPMLQLVKTLYARGIRRASCVFFQNAENEHTFESLGLLHGPHRLVPGSGVDLSEHTPIPYRKADPVRFLYCGRIMREKGVFEFLEAARQLHSLNAAEQLSPSVEFALLGDYDENDRAVFEEAARQGVIRLLGFHTDVDRYYGDCSALVLPTYHEGMSNVLMEASACARPVIATDISGCREIFDEGVTGFGCRPQDAESLVRAMKKFLALGWKEREAMGQAARAKMEREFDRRKVTAAYLEEIEKAI